MSKIRNTVTATNALIKAWYLENRNLPTYKYGNGQPFLRKMLDVEKEEWCTLGESYQICNEASPGIYEKLLGPHGWTVMRALIVRYEERTKNEAVQKHAGLQEP